MSNTNYQRGVRFERSIIHKYKNLGYTVLRTAGSHGFADVIAYSPKLKRIKFIQCKTKKRVKSSTTTHIYPNPLESKRNVQDDFTVETFTVTKFIR